MDKTYLLYNAITLNATGNKWNILAIPMTSREIKKHQHHFTDFNFEELKSEGNTVYKVCRENEEGILQGMFAFKEGTGFLDCANMEVSEINKRPIILYSGVGKAMVAVCCKISLDLGYEGYISFTAKNRLFNYYKRMGACQIGASNKFYINEKTAAFLIDAYFNL